MGKIDRIIELNMKEYEAQLEEWVRRFGKERVQKQKKKRN